MPTFRKGEEELVTHFDKWMYVLKNLPNFKQGLPSYRKWYLINKDVQNENSKSDKKRGRFSRRNCQNDRTLKSKYKSDNVYHLEGIFK